MSSRHPSPMQHTHDLERRARQAAALKFGWLAHLTVFVCVNAGLWLAGHRGGWLGLPTGGWIIGLLAHTLVVWLRPLWAMGYEQVLQRERERLQEQQPRDTQP